MATATPNSTYYWYNEGWNTGTLGVQAGYISTNTNGRVVVQPITVTPTSGYKVTSVTFKFGVALGSGNEYTDPTIYAQAYSSLDGAKNNTSSTKLGNEGNNTIDINSSGGMYSITMTGLSITSQTTIYVRLRAYSEKYNGYYLQYWPKISGNITALPSGSAVESVNGYVYIYADGAWKKAIPYVYNGSAWKQAIPYVYNGSAWKTCGG